MSIKSYIINSVRMGSTVEQALQKLGFGGSSSNTSSKLKAQVNKSYTSQEFAGEANAGSDFFNQTKQRGTLFGN